MRWKASRIGLTLCRIRYRSRTKSGHRDSRVDQRKFTIRSRAGKPLDTRVEPQARLQWGTPGLRGHSRRHKNKGPGKTARAFECQGAGRTPPVFVLTSPEGMAARLLPLCRSAINVPSTAALRRPILSGEGPYRGRKRPYAPTCAIRYRCGPPRDARPPSIAFFSTLNAINRVRPEWHLLNLLGVAIVADVRAGDRAWCGEQRVGFWSSLDGSGLDATGALEA